MRRSLLVAWDLWEIDPYWRNSLIVAITGIIVIIFSGATAPPKSTGGQQSMGSYSGGYSPSSNTQSQPVVTPSPQPIKIAPSVTIGTVTAQGTKKINKNIGFATVVNVDDDSDQDSTFADPSFKIEE